MRGVQPLNSSLESQVELTETHFAHIPGKIMANRRQPHEINPNFCRAARRALQQLARTLDRRQDQVEKQERIINFFVQFLADQNTVLDAQGLFDGALPTFHTIDRNGHPDSRVFQFHELQQQALKDMLTHNFDNFRVRNDASQNARERAHNAEAARLVSWRNRAITAENELTAYIAAADDAIDNGPPSAPSIQSQLNTDQANEVQAIEVQANDANEIQANNAQINADVSYEPTSYKTAYPVNDNKANGSIADKVAAHIADIAAKIDVNEDAPGLETKASNRKVSVALTKNRTSIEATLSNNIQPRF
jgi:hypothetical protein